MGDDAIRFDRISSTEETGSATDTPPRKAARGDFREVAERRDRERESKDVGDDKKERKPIAKRSIFDVSREESGEAASMMVVPKFEPDREGGDGFNLLSEAEEGMRVKSKSNPPDDPMNLLAGVDPQLLLSSMMGGGKVEGVIEATDSVPSPSMIASMGSMEEIATFIGDRMTVLSQPDGVNHLVVEVQNIPLFEGAKVVVTTYNTAPLQYNIALYNLTPEAQKVVALQRNREEIVNILAENGYTVHMISASTEPFREGPVAFEEMQPQADQRDQDQREKGKRERGEKEKDS